MDPGGRHEFVGQRGGGVQSHSGAQAVADAYLGARWRSRVGGHGGERGLGVLHHLLGFDDGGDFHHSLALGLHVREVEVNALAGSVVEVGGEAVVAGGGEAPSVLLDLLPVPHAVHVQHRHRERATGVGVRDEGRHLAVRGLNPDLVLHPYQLRMNTGAAAAKAASVWSRRTKRAGLTARGSVVRAKKAIRGIWAAINSCQRCASVPSSACRATPATAMCPATRARAANDIPRGISALGRFKVETYTFVPGLILRWTKRNRQSGYRLAALAAIV